MSVLADRLAHRYLSANDRLPHAVTKASLPTGSDAARIDISLLHNFALAGEVQRLAMALQVRERVTKGPLSRLAGIVEEEWRDGWAGWRRLVLRVLRSLVYRLFHIDMMPHLASRSYAAAAPISAVLPTQYARLDDALRAWCRTSFTEAQRSPETPSLAATRERWGRFATAHVEAPFLAGLQPHEGRAGNLRVLVLLGGGGFGDALMFSAVLAALWQRLAQCDIVLLYEKSVVVPLYAGNPTVACAVAAPWGELQEAMVAARWLGIFDLVVDAFCFLPRYLVCERSRIDMDRHGAWLAGNEQLADLIERFSSNLGISLIDRACNIHVFDLLASITGLPIDAASPLIFSPDPTALAQARARGLPKYYVTIRDSSNPSDLAFARSLGVERTTKQLPLAKLKEVVALLHANGLIVVQVGDSSDPLIVGANIDLRGRTQLSELCFIMKGAVAHVDTEGGLAHFARAVNVPAVVFFGTTSDTFFGYPGNLNLSSPACGRCWYSNATWLVHCPRGTEGPECTAGINLDPLRRKLSALIAARHRPRPRVVARALFGDPIANPQNSTMSFTDWALSLARRWATMHLPDRQLTPRFGVMTPAPGGITGRCVARLVTDGIIVHGSLHNMPANDATYDVVVCVDVLDSTPEPAAALDDLLRLVRPGGLMVIAIPIAAAPKSPDVDPATLVDCLGEAAWFDPDAVAASAAALRHLGVSMATNITWACICMVRPRPGMDETTNP